MSAAMLPVQITLRWEMAIQRTLHSLVNSAEIAVLSLLSCKPPKTTWESGEGGEHVILTKWPTCNSIIHRFTSNHWDNGIGFRIGYESSDVYQWSYNSGRCGCSFITLNGILTSPSTFGPNCTFTISQPTGTVILLKFHIMEMRGYSAYQYTCSEDYLEIRDGSSAFSPVLARLCGNEVPPLIQSRQNQVWMKWGHTGLQLHDINSNWCVQFQVSLYWSGLC